MSRRDQGLWTIFAWPLILSILALVGLVGALLWDGAWDGAGAALLALSMMIVAWVRLRPPRRR